MAASELAPKTARVGHGLRPAARVAPRWETSWERDPFIRVIYDDGAEVYGDYEEECELVLVFLPEGDDE